MKGGWLVPGTPVENGIARIGAQCTEGDPEYTDVYHQVQRLESFHRSGHWPEVLDVMARAIGDEVLPQPQKICRLWFPQYTEHTTPTHQDYVHFQGSYDTYTCWAPVGDCPVELGGLADRPIGTLSGGQRKRTFVARALAQDARILLLDEPFAGVDRRSERLICDSDRRRCPGSEWPGCRRGSGLHYKRRERCFCFRHHRERRKVPDRSEQARRNSRTRNRRAAECICPVPELSKSVQSGNDHHLPAGNGCTHNLGDLQLYRAVHQNPRR